MASLATTYTFASGATIASAQVNQNFTDVETFVNGNVPHCDGTNVFTGQPQFTGTSAEGDLDNLVNMRYLLSSGYSKAISDNRGGSNFATKTSLGTTASGTYATALSGNSCTMTNGDEYYAVWGFENAHSSLTGGSAYPLVARLTMDADVFYTFGWQPASAGSGTWGHALHGSMYFAYSGATGSVTPTLALASYGVGSNGLGYYGASYLYVFQVNT